MESSHRTKSFKIIPPFWHKEKICPLHAPCPSLRSRRSRWSPRSRKRRKRRRPLIVPRKFEGRGLPDELDSVHWAMGRRGWGVLPDEPFLDSKAGVEIHL